MGVRGPPSPFAVSLLARPDDRLRTALENSGPGRTLHERLAPCNRFATASAHLPPASTALKPSLQTPSPNLVGPYSQVLQSHPPVTGVLKREILESALGSAPEGAPGNRGAPGSAPESAQGNWGCSRECSRECSVWGVNRKSTLGSTPWSTPNFPEHSREHSPEHPDFPEHPREHFREHFQGFPTSAPL